MISFTFTGEEDTKREMEIFFTVYDKEGKIIGGAQNVFRDPRITAKELSESGIIRSTRMIFMPSATLSARLGTGLRDTEEQSKVKCIGKVVITAFEQKRTLVETVITPEKPNPEPKRVTTTPAQPQTPPPSPQETNRATTTSEFVWRHFGLRVTPVTKEELQRRTEGMDSPYIFEGAVEVLEVNPGGIFAPLKIQKGDMLAAIITPKDPWNITRVADLKYIAEHWTPEQMGCDEAKIIVVRDKKLLEGKVPVSKSNQVPKALEGKNVMQLSLP